MWKEFKSKKKIEILPRKLEELKIYYIYMESIYICNVNQMEYLIAENNKCVGKN